MESGRHLYGGPRQVLLLLRGLRDKGVENVLVCPAGSAIAAARPAAELREIAMGGDVDLPLIMRLRNEIRDSGADLVHLHSRRGADWLGGLAALRLGVPVVLSRRVDNRETRILAAAKYALVDRVIAISRGIYDVLLRAGVSPAKLRCVRSAVPPPADYPGDRPWLESEFGIPQDAPAIAVVAQLIARKGHRFLLDALPEIVRRHPHARVILFGTGSAETAIRNQVSEQGLSRVVQLAGFRDDLPRVLPCLDLVVHPALKEGLGVALLQAASAGLPLVASRAGGIPETMIDGQTGLLVPPGDASAIASAVNRLLDDPAGAAAMGKAGAAYVAQEFSVEQMVDGNLDVYRTI